MLWYKVRGQAEMKCENCRFWLRKKEAAPTNGMIKGICVRYPPKGTGSFLPVANRIANTVQPQLFETTTWPTTNNAQWCGEWRKISLGEQMVEEILDDRNRKTPKQTQKSQ